MLMEIMGFSSMLEEISMKDNGEETEPLAMESILAPRVEEESMKVNGKMICKKASAKNAGLMEVSMKEDLIKVLNME
jgi:hypothetical protein